MTATALVGSTGLVGGNILSTLLSHPAVTTVSAFTRRALDVEDPNSRLRPVVDSDTANWPGEFESFKPSPKVLYSGLGTTRAQAGGLAAQRAIDFDLNLNMARAAKEAGVKVYVLISSSGASKSSYFAYPRMKGELEEAVTELGFEKTVIVRPGLIIGQRKDSRPAEYVVRLLALFMGKISAGYLKDPWAQDADVIGKAAVSAGLKCLDGSAPAGNVWFVNMADIIRLGRVEWKP